MVCPLENLGRERFCVWQTTSDGYMGAGETVAKMFDGLLAVALCLCRDRATANNYQIRAADGVRRLGSGVRPCVEMNYLMSGCGQHGFKIK